MFLIYGTKDDPASLLVEQHPASTTPEKEYLVVNGAYWLQEVVRGDRDHLHLSYVHRREDPDADDRRVATLTMEWGPTMTPRDSRAKLLPKGTRWDYNDVLDVARKLLAGGPVATWAERLEMDAAERNPPPAHDWDPEVFG